MYFAQGFGQTEHDPQRNGVTGEELKVVFLQAEKLLDIQGAVHLVVRH